MTTAVDSSVLLDVLADREPFARVSREALRAAYDDGALVACDVVWAEVAAHFPNQSSFHEVVETLGIRYDPVSEGTAILAGSLRRAHRVRGGPRTNRVVPDFLVGAHALRQAERLLTRDRGFYRAHFAELELLDPSAG